MFTRSILFMYLWLINNKVPRCSNRWISDLWNPLVRQHLRKLENSLNGSTLFRMISLHVSLLLVVRHKILFTNITDKHFVPMCSKKVLCVFMCIFKMVSSVWIILKTFPAFIANERFGPCMSVHVFFQSRFRNKCFWADITLEGTTS